MLAANPETGAALGDACRSAGYRVAVLRDASSVRLPDFGAVVWDTTSRLAADPAVVAGLKLCFAAAPLVAVLGFPRADEIASVQAAGVAAVVSKPFLLEDLHWQLDTVTADGEPSQSSASPASSRLGA